MSLSENVRRGIEEIRAAFSGHDVGVVEDGQGGARVVVGDVDLGAQHVPSRGPIGFLLGFQYDSSDVYPHFVTVDMNRADGKPLGGGLSKVQWNNGPAVQISRRSHGWRAGVDTAAMKLQKVLEWLRTQ